MTVAGTPADFVAAVPADPQPVFRRAPRTAVGQLLSRRSTVASLVIVAAYVLAGLVASVPAIVDAALPAAVSRHLPLVDRWGGAIDHAISDPVGDTYQPPHAGLHPSLWLGTDILGRSVLWRVIYGTRVALIITAGTSVLSLFIGTVLGVVSGYFGGWIDALITWLFTTVNSIPWILLVVAITFALQGYEFANGETFKERYGDLPAIILALGLTDWVGLCRLLRGDVFKHRASDYVAAARAAGAGTTRILFRHILPNVTHLVIITFSLSAVGYVQAEVALTFIGIGISDRPSWGRMITDSRLEILRGVWWEAAAASVAIFVISWALNVVGDALRDALDPKLRGRN
jgi:ABC-type dipeptide/oligopeptide/nickel transport system permease subunit